MRYMLESIGPEIRQYFIESDSHAEPYSREQRALVYSRAKGNHIHTYTHNTCEKKRKKKARIRTDRSSYWFHF